MPSPVNAYDSVLYPNRAFVQTHPDRLAVMATLFGMSPAPVERCLVLELACGDGSNLIPMAYGLPHSEFYGVDLAADPVGRANEMIHRLGLQNIRIERKDLLGIDESLGKFDYIIAHGVYAWVPERVQERILAICSVNLAANGIAFVSYNTNPAGHVRQMLREITQFHTSQRRDVDDKVRAGREFAEAILRAAEEGSTWKALLQEEFRVIYGRDDRVVFHDDLGECFAPVSFAEFARRAADVGLQVLGDAKFKSLVSPDVSGEGLQALQQLAGDDQTAYQHYVDFAKYRRFRETLLCHRETSLERRGVLREAEKLCVASPLKVTAERADGSVEFANSRGHGTVATNNPQLTGVLKHLEATWPRCERLAELLERKRRDLSNAPANDVSSVVVQPLLNLAANNLVDLRAHEIVVANQVSEKPLASLLARAQAQAGSLLTTLLHTHVELDEEGRQFLQLLDGTRNHREIAAAVAADPSGSCSEGALPRVEEYLAGLCRMGLLLA